MVSGSGLDLFSLKRSFVAHSVSLSSAHHPDITRILLNRMIKRASAIQLLLMVEENSLQDQLSFLEGFPLCGETSHLKAVSFKCQTGILYTLSSCFVGGEKSL